MSRCFPYPPPGFNGKRAIDEALIQSIKLQKDLEKVSTERRKEKKREKEEKRRETKKHKETANLTSAGIAYEEYAHKGEKSCTMLKGGSTNKRKLEDAEQLERSDITEEHGKPHSLQNPSYSSDSTQNSNKRRKQATSVNLDNSRGHGNIIRIRLPLQKHKEPAISASKEQLSSPSGKKGHKESDVSASEEQICSTSGNKDILGHRGHDVGRRTSSQDDNCSSLGTNNVFQGLSFGPDKEFSCSTSGRTKGLTLDDNRITSGFSSCAMSCENEMQKIDLYSKFLIQNLVPPALPSDLSNIDDDEWLFGRKHSDGAVEKRFKASGAVSCCASSTLWPHAQYLSEAEIYALPYTHPF